MAGTPLQIVVGLGNPGPEHRLTRHNAGFWFVDALARVHSAPFRPHARYQGEIAKVTHEGHELILLKPQTYMNRSGLAIRALVDYVKAPVTEVLVVHDELDLPPGTVRVKVGGGLAGNNGLRSITAHLHTQDYLRVRIGIGKPPSKEHGAGHVLSKLPPRERELLDVAVQHAADAVEMLLAEGPDAAQRVYNTRTLDPT